jgi:hypothetical protein
VKPAPIRTRLFGDRGARLRAGLVAAALVGLTVYAEIAWEYEHPAVEQCLAEPARYDGKTVWMGPVRVERADEAGFDARTIRGAEIRVVAPAGAAAAGSQIALRGTFRRSDAAGGLPSRVVLHVENGRPVLRPAPGGIEKRYGMFALSAAVLAYVAWRFVRAFRIAGGQIDLKPGSRFPNPAP